MSGIEASIIEPLSTRSSCHDLGDRRRQLIAVEYTITIFSETTAQCHSYISLLAIWRKPGSETLHLYRSH